MNMQPVQRELPLENLMARPGAYAEGRVCGLDWDANWMPGGPNVYTYRNNSYGAEALRRQRMQLESEQTAKEWLQGFADGLEVRLRENARFAAWWAEHRYQHGHFRYYEPDSIQ